MSRVVSEDTPVHVESRTISLEGLGDFKIGQPFDDESYEYFDNYEDGSCVYVVSEELPGVVVIMSNGIVRLISVYDEESSVRLTEGAGLGSTETELLELFPALTKTPHFYGPGSYLTEPGNGARRKFEMDTNAIVTAFHVGLRPELEYVEGCL